MTNLELKLQRKATFLTGNELWHHLQWRHTHVWRDKTRVILYKFTGWIEDKTKIEKDDVSAAANDYLKTLGYVAIAYAWIKVLEVSFKDYNENKNFYDDKIDTARFYFDKVLPRAEQHYKSAISGSSNIMNFKFN